MFSSLRLSRAPERTRRRGALALALTVLSAGLVLLPTLPASAAIDAGLTIEKTVTGGATRQPGDSFTYVVKVECSTSVAAGCIDATLVDDLPAPMIFDPAYPNPVTVQVSNSGTSSVAISGTTATVTFTKNLGDGDTGLEAGRQATATLRVKVPTDASADSAGTITNTATVSADNADTKSASAGITLAVTSHLEAGVTKERDTALTIPAIPGTAVDFTLVGTNESNQSVTTMSIQDPVDPAAGSNPFAALEVTGIGKFVPPAGAENVQVEWADAAGVWTQSYSAAVTGATTSMLPASKDAIRGLRFTFTSTTGTKIPMVGTATIGIDTVTRSSVAAIAAGTTTTLTNTVRATVGDAGNTSTPVDDSAQVRISNVSPTVTTSKEYDQDDLIGGESALATIRTDNQAMPVHSMTISEPGSGGDFADQGLLFEGFKADDIEWPAGATSALVTYHYANGAQNSHTTQTRDTLPAQTGAVENVVGFEITFSSAADGIEPYAYAVLPFSVRSLPVTGTTTQTAVNTTASTVVDSLGRDATATASDSLDRLPVRVATTVTKSFTPDTLYAVPGSTTLVNLTAAVAQRPASTVGSDYLEISDPASEPSAATSFWSCFQIRNITDTAIPANTTLQVQTWDGDTWSTLASGVGPQTSWSHTIPAGDRAAIEGIKFRFTRNGGGTLEPGFNVAPNFNVSVRAAADCLTEPSSTTYFNHALSEVANAANSLPPVTEEADDDLTLLPVTGAGPDTIDKAWIDPAPAGGEIDPVTVGALTGETRTAKINWSTQGLAFDTVTISDPASPTELSNVSSSIYDAFNLTRIEPITPTQDAQITHDRVSKVELYSRIANAGAGGWSDVTAQACQAGCSGAFGGFTVPALWVEDTAGVRLTFVSRTTGEPVAISAGNKRVIRLGFTLRDTRRSDATAHVLGQHHSYGYNTGDQGMVRNTALMVGTSSGFTHTDSDNAEAVIIDRPLNVELTKSNAYSALGLPPAGTAADQYPLLDTNLEATNSTTAKVTGLRIQDPSPGTAVEDSVFDTLNLADIRSITLPAGVTASDVSVVVKHYPGGTQTWTYAEALAKTGADLASVVSIDVTATKDWLAPEATLGLGLTFQLRPTKRISGDAMTTTADPAAPVRENVALATVSGPGGTGVSCVMAPPGDPCDAVEAEASATFQVQPASYDVVATKAINRATRYEEETLSGYVVTLSGQPTGTARTELLTITDDDPRFWNAFNLTSITAIPAAGPFNQARVSVLTSAGPNLLKYEEAGGTLTASCNGTSDLSACWVTGDWKAVSAGAIEAPIPATVTASTVRGVKIEARSVTNGTPVQWERPNNQKVTVSLNVTRRVNLWWSADGGNVTPVPSTLPGMVKAPGEPVQGTINNTVRVDGTASWLNPSTPGTPFAASDDAAASTKLLHRVNKIRVRKAPGQGAGTARPLFENGDTIPYSITVTNSGSYTTPGSALTIVDAIGLHSGALPVDVPADADFSYALKDGTGTTVAIAPRPTATTDPAAGTITFGFTNGFQFRAGYVLTITANLKVRADLPAGATITNRVRVISSRDFEECRGATEMVDDPITGSATTPVEECAASTTVEVQSSAPLGMVKRVRGVGAGLTTATPGAPHHDDLGVLADTRTNTTDCEPGGSGAADSQGFYTWPCVPITRPGGTEEWKIEFGNGGNTNASVVAGIDVLPAKGDTSVKLNTQRGSKFGVTLLDSFQSNVAGLHHGADASFQVFTTTTVPSVNCNEADIKHTTTPGGLAPTDSCYAEVTGRTWHPLTLAHDGDDLSNAKAFKFVVTFGDGSNPAETRGLRPNEMFTFTYRTTTPLYPALATDQASGLPIAWNSVAAGSRMTAAGSQPASASMVSEPRQVGVAMPTGQVTVTKAVSAPTWASPITLPSSYDFDIECSSAGATVPLTGPLGTEDRSSFSVPAGGATTYNSGSAAASRVNLPWGASCEITETGQPAGAGVTYAPSTQTVIALRDFTTAANIMDPIPAPTGTASALTVTNTYSAGGFTVSKTVDDGGAVDQDGDPISYGPFGFTASCTYLGQEAVASADRTFTLAAGASKTFLSLPTGAECTVSETDADGADGTSFVLTTDGTAASAVTDDEVEFTILAGSTAKVAAAFSNTFTTGSLEVTKVLAGNGATAWGTEEFGFHATCTLDGDTVYDGDSPAITATNRVWTIEDLPTGAACVVTEPKAGGANSTALDPVAGTATIGDGTTAEVEVTNTFTLGALTVEKVLAGPAATDPGAVNGSYTMELSCTRMVNGAAVSVTIPGGASKTITGEGEATWTGLPTGATCAVEEAESVPSTPDVVVSPSSVVIGSDQTTPVEVSVTNTFETGTISVAKALTGAAVAYAPTTFEVTVSCDFPVGVKIALPNSGVITLNADGAPVTLSAIPTGAVCTASETDAAQTAVAYSPTSLTVGDGTTVAMTVTNTYDAGAIQIVKSLAGVGASVAQGPFEFATACTFNGGTVPVAPLTLAVKPGATTPTTLTSDPITGLPVGTECTVTETTSGNAVHAADPVTVTVSAGSDVSPVAANLTNRFGAGVIAVTKIAKGAHRNDAVFKKRPVKVNVTCEYTQGAQVATVINRNLEVFVGTTATLTGTDGKQMLAPVGAECWVTELDSLGATRIQIANGSRATSLAVPAGTATATSTLTFEVVNTYREPPTGSVSNLSQERGDKDRDGSGDDDGNDGDRGNVGGISDTGSAVQPWMVGLVGLMLVAGVSLVLAARRRS